MLTTFKTVHILILAALFCFSFPDLAHAASQERRVKLAWKPLENVKKYDVQVSRSPRMDPELLRKLVVTPDFEVTLEPGTYFFRVRGIDETGAPGPWAEVQGFAVTSKPPELKAPDDAQVYAKPPEAGIRMEWEGKAPPKGFLLEISDAKGTVLSRTVTDTSLIWKPLAAGAYQWRVGVESLTRTDWSTPRRFTVKAMPTAAVPGTLAVAIVEENQDEGAPSSVSLIGRWAQAVLAYSGRDQDLGITSSGAAVVALLSAELRWRARRPPERTWLLSGAVNFEMVRQTVLNQTFSLPRYYGRLFYTQGREAWRVGPFVEVGSGTHGIFIAQGANKARNLTLSRTGIGAGGVAVYQTSPKAYLSALALLRMDGGATSSQLPGPLESNLGWETGFGAVLQLSSSTMIEGRLRALHEAYSWKALTGGESSQANTFLILDLGFGFKF